MSKVTILRNIYMILRELTGYYGDLAYSVKKLADIIEKEETEDWEPDPDVPYVEPQENI